MDFIKNPIVDKKLKTTIKNSEDLARILKKIPYVNLTDRLKFIQSDRIDLDGIIDNSDDIACILHANDIISYVSCHLAPLSEPASFVALAGR